MDFTQTIESFDGIACVLSYKKDDDNELSITIAAANENYLASVGKTRDEFIPFSPYTEFISRDPNFESMVSRCCENRSVAHQYVNAGLYKAWIDIYMIPLQDDENGNRYCLFTYEMTKKADSDKLVDISSQTASLVLKTCIKLRETDDFNAAIKSIVNDIRIQCGAKAACILLADFEEETIDILGVDHDDSFAPKEDDVFFTSEFYNVVKTWDNLIDGSNCYIISKDEDFEEIKEKSKGWYDSLIYSNVKNLVLYPLRIEDSTIGYIFVNNFNTDKIIFIREFMELNAFILSAEISNYLMRKKLEVIGNTDMLTGVLNRNAMNNQISEFVSKEKEVPLTYGLIFIDVNGLKEVNDTSGHQAGDDMLKSVANKLKGIFNKEEIYRAGGDEFLVIAKNVNAVEFSRLVQKLKDVSNVPGEPTFAMGYYFGEQNMDIRNALHIADGNMYKDKAEYYKNHPKLDRRQR